MSNPDFVFWHGMNAVDNLTKESKYFLNYRQFMSDFHRELMNDVLRKYARIVEECLDEEGLNETQRQVLTEAIRYYDEVVLPQF